jgi:hypothetical protein
MDQSPGPNVNGPIESQWNESLGIEEFTQTEFWLDFDDYHPLNHVQFSDSHQKITPLDDITASDCIPMPPSSSESNSVPKFPLIAEVSPGERLDLIEPMQEDPGRSEPDNSAALRRTVKPRRGRKDQRMVFVGPNRFGRKGTIRCEVCRHWRRKVQGQ